MATIKNQWIGLMIFNPQYASNDYLVVAARVNMLGSTLKTGREFRQ